MTEPVCWRCFDDYDLIIKIKQFQGPRGCTYCGRSDAATAPFDEIAEFIGARLGSFYGLAVDQLPYDGREGGYQGLTWETEELLNDHLELPRDNDEQSLLNDLLAHIGFETWCEYDWLSLDEDVALGLSWKTFCDTIKHERRFFFQDHGYDPEDRDTHSPIRLLRIIGRWVQDLNLITQIPKGTRFYRARSAEKRRPWKTPKDLGPPDRAHATQSNRMNPAGIPMFYLSEAARTAAAETPSPHLTVAAFETLKDLKVIDLCRMPPTPGFFSESEREERLAIKFLNKFLRDIMNPVSRIDGAHIDYLPSQVVTEYFRTRRYQGGAVNGIRYGSVADPRGANIVFFAEPENLQDAMQKSEWSTSDYWFRLVGRRTVRKISDDT